MLELEYLESIAEIGPAQWNAISGIDYPFTRYEFLWALEQSGAVGGKSGWQSQHLIVRRGGDVVGVMPLYIKSHSYGEYVFDWSWAEAYQRHGLPYYPKLVAAIPFTPATGPRLCVRDGEDMAVLIAELALALPKRVAEIGASSLHILFSSRAIASQWQAAGMLGRTGPQYHWYNRGYRDFDEFLTSFTSRKRKSLKKERRIVREQGLSLQALSGEQVSAEQWQFFFHCYQLTYAKRSGHGGYLAESFFTELARTIPEQMLLVMAYHEGKPVAAALNFRDSSTLYGRYWGCLQEFEYLHFEACYYQGIEYCLQEGLARFDPGAQGEHKIQRGFEPIKTYSNHWLADANFSAAVARFLDEEADHIDSYIADAAKALPFREVDEKV
ncbi:MAG: GNAT family N-acetyltransferase [Spongiibacteraceae bacterium]